MICSYLTRDFLLTFNIKEFYINYDDLRKIKSKLNFEVKITFNEGILRFVRWVNSQESKGDI